MVTAHRSHRDAVESPHLGIFTYSQDTALGNLLQVTQLHPSDQVIPKGHFPLQTICFCKKKELQCPMIRPDKRCCYAVFWGVTADHTAAQQHLSHAANGTCSTPKQGWSKRAKGHSLHPCWKGNSSSGISTQREIPHLDTG